jgi:dCTP deaminase
MILPDFIISKWAGEGGLTPYEPGNVNPASVDLRLGDVYIDLANECEYALSSPLVLPPGRAILATTVETVKLPAHLAGAVYLKSSLARQGLDHALAGWVDPGFEGQLTLELHAHRTLELAPGQKIVQLVLMQLVAHAAAPYQGRYQGQQGPTLARPLK